MPKQIVKDCLGTKECPFYRLHDGNEDGDFIVGDLLTYIREMKIPDIAKAVVWNGGIVFYVEREETDHEYNKRMEILNGAILLKKGELSYLKEEYNYLTETMKVNMLRLSQEIEKLESEKRENSKQWNSKGK